MAWDWNANRKFDKDEASEHGCHHLIEYSRKMDDTPFPEGKPIAIESSTAQGISSVWHPRSSFLVSCSIGKAQANGPGEDGPPHRKNIWKILPGAWSWAGVVHMFAHPEPPLE
jgi:hypothetical protein